MAQGGGGGGGASSFQIHYVAPNQYHNLHKHTGIRSPEPAPATRFNKLESTFHLAFVWQWRYLFIQLLCFLSPACMGAVTNDETNREAAVGSRDSIKNGFHDESIINTMRARFHDADYKI